MAANERGKGMREEIQTFIHYMEEEKQASKNTMLSYQRDLLKMADYLEENGITECGKVTKTALNSYLLFQGEEGKAASTVSRSLASAKSFFGWMHRRGMIRRDPAESACLRFLRQQDRQQRERGADDFDFEAEQASERMITLIQPLMIIFLAVVICLIIISVLLPIYTLYNNVGNM